MYMKMIRKNFFITQEEDRALKAHKDISVSEHIRRALDEHILKLNNKDAVESPSPKVGTGAKE